MDRTDNRNDVDVIIEDEQMEPDKSWLFKKGVSGNPGGRPKDPIRQYLRRKFQGMSDEDIESWLTEHKIPGVYQWAQAEGQPTEDKNVTISVPTPILGGITNAQALESSQKALQGEVIDQVTE